MSKILKFALDNIEEIDEKATSAYEKKKKERFAKVKIRLFGDGENAHTEPVDLEAIKRSADSAYDIPLIAELNPYRMENDFGGHGTLTGKECCFGVIKESKDNPSTYEHDSKTGKTYLTLYGLIWRKYFNNIVDILISKDNQTEVSVELDQVEGGLSQNGKPKLEQFVLNGVTFLGRVTSAACQGSMAQLCFSIENSVAFEKDKEMLFSNTIEIVNSKETAVDSQWTNPRLKLLGPIREANNRSSLLKEAYLFAKDTGEETTLSDVSYPHHVVRNGKLLLHIKGVQGKVEGAAKQHLLRHYRTLGLNTENFKEFGLTQEQFLLYFAEDLRKEDAMLDETKTLEQEEQEAIEGLTCDEAPGAVEKSEDKEDEEVEKEEEKREDDEEADKDDKDEEIEKEDAPTYEELMEKVSKLQAENDAFMCKLQEMADYDELKKFREDVIEKERQEAEMAEMTKVICGLESKGVKMSEDIKQEFYEKRNDFANISAWSNYVKAYAFDNCEISREDGIVNFELPKSEKASDEKYGSWASLINKYGK